MGPLQRPHCRAQGLGLGACALASCIWATGKQILHRHSGRSSRTTGSSRWAAPWPRLQAGIAFGVAIQVVVLLEKINVHQQQRQGLAAAHATLPFGLQRRSNWWRLGRPVRASIKAIFSSASLCACSAVRSTKVTSRLLPNCTPPMAMVALAVGSGDAVLLAGDIAIVRGSMGQCLPPFVADLAAVSRIGVGENGPLIHAGHLAFGVAQSNPKVLIAKVNMA